MVEPGGRSRPADVEEIRPRPRRPPGATVAAYLRWVGPGRIIAVATSVVAVAVGGSWLLRTPPPPVEDSLPRAVPASSSSIPSSSSDGFDASDPLEPGPVLVHVAGAVASPGVVSVPPGSRVHEAISAAGGLALDAVPDAVNLAAVVADGQQIYVPHTSDAMPRPAPVASASAEVGAPTGPVDLNRASAADLDVLPGVGPVTAAAIVAHRDLHGPFSSVEDLLEVSGIGPARLEELRDLVRV